MYVISKTKIADLYMYVYIIYVEVHTIDVVSGLVQHVAYKLCFPNLFSIEKGNAPFTLHV